MIAHAPHSLLRGSVLWLGLFLLPQGAPAQQAETAAMCDEGVIPEPVSFVYGDHTEGCGISPAPEIDTFVFDCVAGDEVRLIVHSFSNGFDPELEIRDPDFQLLVDGANDGAWCNGSSGFGATTCSFQVDLVCEKLGPYSLALSDVNTNEAGSYVLQLERIQPVPPAVPINYDEALDDTISPVTDIDFFSYEGTPGTQVRFNLRSRSNGFDPAIEIRDPTGALVVNGTADNAWCNGSSGFGATTCTLTVDLDPTLAGTYSLLVYDVGANEAGNYQLALWCLFGPCQPTPPRMSFVTAVRGAIDPVVDGDFWTFQGTVGTALRVNLRSTTNGFDPEMQIRQSSGVVVVNGAVDGASCPEAGAPSIMPCSFSVDFIPETPGIHSILLHDSGTNEIGNYHFNVECLSGPCDSDSDGIEDGVGPILEHDSTVSSSLDPSTEVDFYVFQGTAGTLVRFNVLSRTNGFDPAVEIRDPNNQLIVRGADSVEGESWCNGLSGFSARICSFSFDLEPAVTGLYRLAIYDVGVSEAGDYQTGLQCLAGGPCSNPVGPLPGDNCIERPNGPLIPDAGGNIQLDTDGDCFGNVCDCDFNNDGVCDFMDLGLLKQQFFLCGPLPEDMNGSGCVEFQDLGFLKSGFFGCPGPSGLSCAATVPCPGA